MLAGLIKIIFVLQQPENCCVLQITNHFLLYSLINIFAFIKFHLCKQSKKAIYTNNWNEYESVISLAQQICYDVDTSE
jgi:hypothetical protein